MEGNDRTWQWRGEEAEMSSPAACNAASEEAYENQSSKLNQQEQAREQGAQSSQRGGEDEGAIVHSIAVTLILLSVMGPS